MYMTSASIWYVNPNVLTDINDTLYIYFAGLNGSGNENQVLVFDKGLYGVPAELNDVIKRKLQEAGNGSTFTGDEIELVPDAATQKIRIIMRPTASTGTMTVNFDGTRNMAGFLGPKGGVLG